MTYEHFFEEHPLSGIVGNWIFAGFCGITQKSLHIAEHDCDFRFDGFSGFSFPLGNPLFFYHHRNRVRNRTRNRNRIKESGTTVVGRWYHCANLMSA